jgi:dipeptidyl aminopeptidase/acylaminoacyl peptidase
VRRLTIALIAGAAALGAWAAGSSGAPPPAPAGPRLAVVLAGSDEAGTHEVITVGPEGQEPRTLTRATFLEPIGSVERPTWSPDGKLLAFYGQGEETPALVLLGANGSNPRVLPSSEHPGGKYDATLPEPFFDPSTGELEAAVLFMPHGEPPFGSERPTGAPEPYRNEFWAFPSHGGKPRRLSSRPVIGKNAELIYPSSIASDGRVAATSLNRRGFSVAVLDPRGGPVQLVVPQTTLKEGSLEPAISPDGSQIVYKVDDQKELRGRRILVGTELMIVPTAGGKPRRLAWVKGGAAFPTWDPSSSRIAFTDLDAAGTEDFPRAQDGNALMEINPDGTCLTKVLSVGSRGAIEGAAWQPGESRGAGPISC